MKVLGFTEETNECDLCGKVELKGTYIVDDLQGNIYHLGSGCVKKHYSLTQKEFTAKVTEGYNEALKSANIEYEMSKEYTTYVLPNTFEYGSDNFYEVRNINSDIIKAKEHRIDEIRTKYHIEKKHFNLNYRCNKIKFR